MLRRALAASLALMALAAPAAIAHQGNPNFKSTATGSIPGLDAKVVNLDDSIEVRAEPGHEVIALGYEDEPYVRFSADGTVEVNERSPAYYLNQDRFADVDVPEVADAKAPPRWVEVAQGGVYAWHDHRIHYMGQGTPPQVTDESVETPVFDWKLPFVVDGDPAQLDGTLTWIPDEGGASVALLAGLGAAVAVAFALFVWRMRRRAGGERDAGAGEGGGEAW
jgi:hypothetical protein